jgi:hypothetical protein
VTLIQKEEPLEWGGGVRESGIQTLSRGTEAGDTWELNTRNAPENWYEPGRGGEERGREREREMCEGQRKQVRGLEGWWQRDCEGKAGEGGRERERKRELNRIFEVWIFDGDGARTGKGRQGEEWRTRGAREEPNRRGERDGGQAARGWVRKDRGVGRLKANATSKVDSERDRTTPDKGGGAGGRERGQGLFGGVVSLINSCFCGLCVSIGGMPMVGCGGDGEKARERERASLGTFHPGE